MSYWSLLEPLMCDRMWIWTRSGGICIIIMANVSGALSDGSDICLCYTFTSAEMNFLRRFFPRIEDRSAFRYILNTFEYTELHTDTMHQAVAFS